jgi:hypothetical protein
MSIVFKQENLSEPEVIIVEDLGPMRAEYKYIRTNGVEHLLFRTSVRTEGETGFTKQSDILAIHPRLESKTLLMAFATLIEATYVEEIDHKGQVLQTFVQGSEY